MYVIHLTNPARPATAMISASLLHHAPGHDHGVDPQAWLADVLAQIAAHPAHRLDELLPWHWKPQAAIIPSQAA